VYAFGPKGYDRGCVTWGFIWLMFVLKIPIVMLLTIVWWAVKQEPDTAEDERGDGGSRVEAHRPSPRRPKPGRRGPHGDPVIPSPPRMRAKTFRGRDRTA
jgi:hypothetical protein